MWRTVRKWFFRLLRWGSDFLAVLVALFAIVAFVVLVAFLVVDLDPQPPNRVATATGWIADNTIMFLGGDPNSLRPTERARYTSRILSVLLAICTILFTIVLPVLAIIKHRQRLGETAIVDVSEVDEVGKDDLETMQRYYQNAEHITIFSGDFDFVLKDAALRNTLRGLARAGKLLLVSYKSPDQITASWGGENDGTLSTLRSCFRFHDRQFKFSLVEHRQGQFSFLSLVPGPKPDRNANLGVHGGKSAHASALVHIVRNLCDIDACKKLPDWEAKVADANKATEKIN